MKLIPIKEVITEKISGEWGDETQDGKGVVIIRTANFLNSGRINFSNLIRREIDPRKVEKKRLISGDIIIEKSGGSPTQPVGRVVLFRNPDNDTYLCNNFTSILRPKKNEVHPDYLFYVLHDNHKKGKTLRHQNKTTGIINLKLDSYLDSEIPLPPLDDQIRIAHLLGKVEGLITQRKQHLQQLDDLLKSVFLEMFGDPVRNEKGWDKPELKDFGKISTGNTPPRIDPENYDNDFIEWIKTDNITSDAVFVTSSAEHLSKVGATKGRSVQNGALLVACIAGSIESIGRSALTNRPVSFNQQINAIQPSKDVNPLYLHSLFKLCRAFVQSRASKGMKKILTKGDFEKITMIKPPIEAQSKFAVIVEKIEGIKCLNYQSLKELETLNGALSQQAFEGKLELAHVLLLGSQTRHHKAVAVVEPVQAIAKHVLTLNLPDT
jgi:type I restriction enzyme, S subunit